MHYRAPIFRFPARFRERSRHMVEDGKGLFLYTGLTELDHGPIHAYNG